MALSWSEEVVPAGTTLIPVNIEYLDKSYIHVYIDSVLLDSDNYSWNSDSLIQLNQPLSATSTVLLVRRTDKTQLYIMFAEGAAFIKENLDTQNKQFLHLAQELVEGRSIDGFYGDISMNGYRITNLGDGVNPGDAINKKQLDKVDQRVANIEGSFVTSTTSYPFFELVETTKDTFSPPFVFDKAAVYINGLCQVPGYSYVVVDNQILLAEPVPAGTEFLARLGEDVTDEDGYATVQQLLNLADLFKDDADRAEAAAAQAELSAEQVADATALRGEISDPNGATYYPLLQIARWRDEGDIRGWGALPGLANAAVATAAINAAYASRAGKTVKIPQVDNDGWYLDGTVNAGYSRTTTHAYGAKIFANFDGVMFDLNPDANPSAIDGANSKAYIKWFGGEFQCIAATIGNSAAFRAYAIRQVTIEDCIFGNSGTVRLNSGIMIAGLGGHNILKNRFLLVNKGIDCPQWATNPADTAGPITTSNFIGNNFILTPGQKAFHVRGGWNRWLIQSGFVNGSGAETFHFTNYADCMGLNIIGVGFEQAVAGGKFIYLQDTSGRSFSSINISGCMFGGDPTAGGHVAIDLERCINVSIGDGTRVEGSTARGNFSVRCDANCADIVIDPSCRLPDPGVSIAMSRAQIAMGKTFQRISELNLSGYNGDAKSSGTVTLDMKTLMGNSYPRQLAPLAYDLIVQCRDSGSATSTTAQVEVSKNTGSATTRTIIDLRGVPNDVRVGGNVHVNAEADGSIALVFTASGTGTLDVWVYVTAIYN